MSAVPVDIPPLWIPAAATANSSGAAILEKGSANSTDRGTSAFDCMETSENKVSHPKEVPH